MTLVALNWFWAILNRPHGSMAVKSKCGLWFILTQTRFASYVILCRPHLHHYTPLPHLFAWCIAIVQLSFTDGLIMVGKKTITMNLLCMFVLGSEYMDILNRSISASLLSRKSLCWWVMLGYNKTPSFKDVIEKPCVLARRHLWEPVIF